MQQRLLHVCLRLCVCKKHLVQHSKGCKMQQCLLKKIPKGQLRCITNRYTHTHPVHPQMRAPKHTQSRLPLMALGFTHMTHDTHVGNNNDAHTKIYTQNLPTLSLRVTWSKHHQPHMPHMLCCEQGNCFHTHKSKHTHTHTQKCFYPVVI